MSQAVMEQPNVSEAFRRTPMNPNLRPEEPVTQAVSPGSDTVTPPQSQPEPQVPPTPPVAPVAQPEQPVYQPDWNAILQQQQRQAELERANSAMQQRLKEQDETIGNLMQLQREYEDLKRQQQLNQDIANIDYSNLATVDADDARHISEGIMKAVDARLAPLQQHLQRQSQYLQQNAQYQEQRFTQQRAQDTLGKIMAKHPDFMSLQQNPNFKAFMQQRDGYSSQTLDARAANEFTMGNAEYITHLVDQFKQAQPSSTSISSVAPVQTATATATPPPTTEQLPTLHELNSMMQMRQISPDQYRDMLGKLRAAQNT